MRARRQRLQVSTFPFLAVLLCAMGSLILLLLVIDRRAKIVARAKAEQAALRLEAEDAKLAAARVRELERRRALLHEALHDQDGELQRQLSAGRNEADVIAKQIESERHQQDELKSLLHEKSTALARARLGLKGRREAAQRSLKQAERFEAERTRMTRELEQLEAGLADLKEARKRDPPMYSLVPYRGRRGDNRKPIYIECAARGIMFHPDKLSLDIVHISSMEVRAEVERRLARRNAAAASAGTPYLLMLVRPDGIETYYQTLTYLSGLKIDFGYEFIESDWVLDFPEGEDRAAQPWMTAQGPPPATGPATLPGRPPAPIPSGGGSASWMSGARNVLLGAPTSTSDGHFSGADTPAAGSTGSGSGSGGAAAGVALQTGVGQGSGAGAGLGRTGYASGAGGTGGRFARLDSSAVGSAADAGFGSPSTNGASAIRLGTPSGNFGPGTGAKGVSASVGFSAGASDAGSSAGGGRPGTGYAASGGGARASGPAGFGGGSAGSGSPGFAASEGSAQGGSPGVAGSSAGGGVAGSSVGFASPTGAIGLGGSRTAGGGGSGDSLAFSGAGGTSGQPGFGGWASAGSTGAGGSGGASSSGAGNAGARAPGVATAAQGTGGGAGGDGSSAQFGAASSGGVGGGAGGSPGIGSHPLNDGTASQGASAPPGTSGPPIAKAIAFNGVPSGPQSAGPPSIIQEPSSRTGSQGPGEGSGSQATGSGNAVSVDPALRTQSPLSAWASPGQGGRGAAQGAGAQSNSGGGSGHGDGGAGGPGGAMDGAAASGGESGRGQGGFGGSPGGGGSSGEAAASQPWGGRSGGGGGAPMPEAPGAENAPPSSSRGDPDVGSLSGNLDSGRGAKPRLVRPSRLVGNRDWIIPVECTADAVILYPFRQRFSAQELTDPGAPGNPLFVELHRLIERRQATLLPGEVPYRPIIRFLVRPDASRTYYLAYPALEGLQVAMTRENLDWREDIRARLMGP